MPNQVCAMARANGLNARTFSGLLVYSFTDLAKAKAASLWLHQNVCNPFGAHLSERSEPSAERQAGSAPPWRCRRCAGLLPGPGTG